MRRPKDGLRCSFVVPSPFPNKSESYMAVPVLVSVISFSVQLRCSFPHFFFAFPVPSSVLSVTDLFFHPLLKAWRGYRLQRVGIMSHPSLTRSGMDKGTHLDDTTVVVLVAATLVLVLLALAASTVRHIYFTRQQRQPPTRTSRAALSELVLPSAGRWPFLVQVRPVPLQPSHARMLPRHSDDAISGSISCFPSSASTSGLSAISDDSTATLVPGLPKKRPLPLDDNDIGCFSSSPSVSGLSAISNDSTATLVPGLPKKRPLPLNNVDVDVDPSTIGLVSTGPLDLDTSRPLVFPGELLPGGGIKTQYLNA